MVMAMHGTRATTVKDDMPTSQSEGRHISKVQASCAWPSAVPNAVQVKRMVTTTNNKDKDEEDNKRKGKGKKESKRR